MIRSLPVMALVVVLRPLLCVSEASANEAAANVPIKDVSLLAVPSPTAMADKLRIACQRSESYDAGDAYPSPQGTCALHRLAGAVAVGASSEAGREALRQRLTAPGATLADHAWHADLGRSITVFRSTASTVSDRGEESSARQTLLGLLRADSEVHFAQPVFVSPRSGLLLVPLQEIILRLKPGVNPQAFFSVDWPAVRPLSGTTDQFILSLPGYTAEQILAETSRWSTNSQVVWAQPNFVQQRSKLVIPNDTYFLQQWPLSNTGQGGGAANADMSLPEAWNLTTGHTNVVIAILDDAVQLDHPDLAANIFVNPGDPVNGLDDDQNGFVDDRNGWNFDTNDNNPAPSTAGQNHGTACASLAAAVGNNSLGIAGVAYRSQILPIKFGAASDSDTATAFYYAAGRAWNGIGTWRGADVISTSMNWTESAVVNDAIHWAATQGREGRGCPVFASSGNDASGYFQFAISNLTAGTHTFRFEYYKDAITSQGEDTVWLDDVAFPGAGVERFEGTTFPPPGWTSGGSVPWKRCVRPDRVFGTGAASAQSGAIGNNQTCYLQTTKTIAAGNLTFFSWTSTEHDYDTLDVYVDGRYRFSDPGGVNDFTVGVGYPASHPDVLAVGASSDFDYRSDYSQFGDGLDFLVPSSGGISDVYSADRTGSAGYSSAASPAGDYYSMFGGTSASAPMAAGVGALVLSMNCDLTGAVVADILRGTASKIGQVPYAGGWNSYYGYGRLNAWAAVSQAAVPTLMFNPMRANNRFSVSVQTVACRTYALEYKTSLAHSAWTALPAISGNGTVQTLVDSAASNSQRFYRVAVR